MFAGTFAPAGWMFCDGQPLPISENETLFQLIGTTYGGDGQSTFNLPDLRGRLPLHQGAAPSGTSFTLGETGGVESVTLTTQQTPGHTHQATATADTASTTSPTGKVLAASTGATTTPYGTDQPTTTLNPQAVGPAGGSQPHTNLMPFECVHFIISLFGRFPSQT
jgi:microcystin-dependent protein